MPVAKAKRSPLWRGPQEDGITFSLLSRFLVDRERFRIYVVEGLRPVPSWDHRTGFGNMWHVCEEALAGRGPGGESTDGKVISAGGDGNWLTILRHHVREQCRQYPMQQEQIDHWYNVVRVAFPHYVDYWSRHPDVIARTPLLQEQVFAVNYTLPSGRPVRLRGKWDSVDSVGKNGEARLFLQENKTKGEINEQKIVQQLTFDLQTMLYLTALTVDQDNSFWRRANKRWRNLPLGGVRYNVVRRPLGGGKGSIRQKKPSKSNSLGESKDDFYARLSDLIRADPASYFVRWNVGVLPADVKRFQERCLNPVLEQLCDWWAAMQDCDGSDYFKPPTPHGLIHWQTPYGIFNPLLEGGSTDLDHYLATGSEAGLERVDTLYGELQ
jgi:hypothetical protein